MHTTLRHIAHVRSGDKGNRSTLSVIAYRPEFYPLLCAQITEARVRDRFGAAVGGPVTRYEIAAIEALNFVLDGALGGGVSRSLAIDVYGKALCAAVLDLEVEVPDDLAPLLAGPPAPANDLRAELLGSWELVDYHRRQGAGTIWPFGKDATGFIQYGEDGRMSATLSRRVRPPMTMVPDAHWRGDVAQWAEAAMTYVAYTGTYRLTGDRIEHHVEASLYPNWVGTVLTRWVSFEERDGERRLRLLAAPFIGPDGDEVISELWWRRWSPR
ncbi:MAG: lipocalin-like domain-containing protein [Sphingomonadaceae bacterium]|nr:lipocalin-like domain-containing protein [Sphingomonadaceae bacterium]